MSKQWQIRRGTSTDNNGFTGAQGELTMDTDTNALRIHDGITQGGHMIDCVVAWQVPTAENNYTWYRKYSSGWVEQGGYTNGGNNTETNISLSVEMSNAFYSLSIAGYHCSNATSTGTPSYRGIYYDIGVITARTATGFTLGNGENITWQVSGMAAA